MRMDISEDWKITGEVTDIKTTISEFQTFFFSRTGKAQLETRLKVINPYFMSYLNNLLE